MSISPSILTGREPSGAPRGNASQRIIATGIVLVFLYYAASVVMTILMAVLLAYFLDPVVEWMENRGLPRGLGALIMVLLLCAVLVGAISALWFRAEAFAEDWPKYGAKLKAARQAVDKRLQAIETHVSEITPEEKQPRGTLRVEQSESTRSFLLEKLGSLTNIVVAATFVPFLVFFMLAAKRGVWHATLQLFPPSQRTQVKLALEKVGGVLRGYVMGNMVVMLILAAACTLLFWALDLDYPLLAGFTSGVLNLVPYFGTILSAIPPLVLGIAKWDKPGNYLIVVGMMLAFHFIGLNVLFPALVGRKVQLSALAVTLALLFWGWLWGAMGFLLGIPVTASIKVICDHIEGWEPVGRWLGG
ncbi:MAG TPA: AI-2E family transporter [Candidatus Acidoferrales bacterium]|nr:AI-2E family transporter [Candidatus Acidoferrales bacterium]